MISTRHMRFTAPGKVLAVMATAAFLCLTPRASAAQRSSDTTWFEEPCLPDSADSFFWTRYDLHGVRIRIPPGARHVKYPSIDELHFRLGEATLRLRLHRDASALFARYYTPERKRRHCSGDIGGLLAEAISFGTHPFYGFAARWPDADRGEWLAAVVQGSRLTEVTQLRRALFTIVFPDERRQGEAMGFWVNGMWGPFQPESQAP